MSLASIPEIKSLTKSMSSDSTPMVRADSGGGGGGHGSGPTNTGGGSSISRYYITRHSNTTTFYSWSKKLAIHSGVPAWKEEVDEDKKGEPNVVESDGQYYRLHYGEIPSENSTNYDWYFLSDDLMKTGVQKEWTNPFTQTFDFFTNNLNGSGIYNYAWPFYYTPNELFSSVDMVKEGDVWKQKQKTSFRGVLTNMWAGCEPVCAILSKLLKNGLFCSHPWNIGLGYMFRKNNIPKLVFVFANEFDNSFTAKYNYYNGYSFQTPLVIPGIDNASVTFCKVHDIKKDYREPLDPYCVRQLKTSDVSGNAVVSAFDKYLNEIGYDNPEMAGQLRTAIQNLVGYCNLHSASTTGVDDSTRYATTSWMVGNKVSNSLGVNYRDYTSEMDLDGLSYPFSGMNVLELLTPYQIKFMEETTHFPRINYKNIRTGNNGFTTSQYDECHCDAPKTVGFYQLRNTFCKVTEPYNTYMFVSDANAPIPLYDVQVGVGDDWWTKENARKVAQSLYLGADESLFDDIGDIPLPDGVSTAFTNKTNVNNPTYGHLMKSNIGYHYSDKPYKSDTAGTSGAALKGLGFGLPETGDAYNISVVFHGLQNPYTSTNLVLATRKDYDDFTKALNSDKPGETIWTVNKKKAWWNKEFKGNGWGTVGDYTGYLFMLCLPCCHTGKKDKEYYEGWRLIYDTKSEAQFVNYLANMILHNAFGVEAAPTTNPPNPGFSWGAELWNYATTGVAGSHIANAGWIDKHLCPWHLWDSVERRSAGKICKYNCTEESIEHIAIAIYDNSGTTGVSEDCHVLLLEKLFSSVSSRMNYSGIIKITDDSWR